MAGQEYEQLALSCCELPTAATLIRAAGTRMNLLGNVDELAHVGVGKTPRKRPQHRQQLWRVFDEGGDVPTGAPGIDRPANRVERITLETKLHLRPSEQHDPPELATDTR